MRILFYRSRTILGRFINGVTKYKYSHVAIRPDKLHVCDVSFGGRVVTRHVKLNKKEYVEFTVDKEFDWIKHDKLLGVKWDILGALSYVLPFVPNPKNYLTCAEYVSIMLGLPNCVTPEELDTQLKKHNYFYKI